MASLDLMEVIKTYFRSFDKKGDGHITKDDFEDVFRHWSQQDRDAMWTAVDRSHNNRVNYEDFVDWCMLIPSDTQGPMNTLIFRDPLSATMFHGLSQKQSQMEEILHGIETKINEILSSVVDKVTHQMQVATSKPEKIEHLTSKNLDSRSHREAVSGMMSSVVGTVAGSMLMPVAVKPEVPEKLRSASTGARPSRDDALRVENDSAKKNVVPKTKASAKSDSLKVKHGGQRRERSSSPNVTGRSSIAAVQRSSSADGQFEDGLAILDAQVRQFDGKHIWVRKDNEHQHREARLRFGRATQRAFESGGYVVTLPGRKHKVMFRNLAEMKAKTQLLRSNGLPESLPHDPNNKPNFVHGGHPIDMAAELALKGKRCVTVNAASAFHPGGGFTSGGRHALEEAFCTQSTLYPSLEKVIAAVGHTEHSEKPYIPVDGAILSPSVEIFRYGTDQGYMIRTDPVTITAVVSVAMFNKNHEVRDAPVDAPTDNTDYENGVLNKMKLVAHAAAFVGADTLIIPDLGCGVFKNDPSVVGRLCGTALRPYRGYFTEVHFTGNKEFYRTATEALRADDVDCAPTAHEHTLDPYRDKKIWPPLPESGYHELGGNYSVSDLAESRHDPQRWRDAFRVAGDGTSNPDMKKIQALRSLIWYQTEKAINCALRHPPLLDYPLAHVAPATTAFRATDFKCLVEVWDMDMLEAASKLHFSDGLSVAVLNMANAYSPGGGFRDGAGAQEENLHRRTDTYRFTVQQAEGLYPILEDACHLSRDVTVMRGAERNGYPFLASERMFKMCLLSCAALEGPRLTKDREYADEKDFELMEKKISSILGAAMVAGCRAVVLSAFGCGAFGNPPEIVARLFKKQLGCWPLSKVVFCIFDDHNAGKFHNPRGNSAPFKEVFGLGLE